MNSPGLNAQRPLVGIAIMLFAMALLPFMDVAAKFLGEMGVPVVQLVWARTCFGALMTLPFVVAKFDLKTVVTPDSPKILVLRSFFLLSSNGLYFWEPKVSPYCRCAGDLFCAAARHYASVASDARGAGGDQALDRHDHRVRRHAHYYPSRISSFQYWDRASAWFGLCYGDVHDT